MIFFCSTKSRGIDRAWEDLRPVLIKNAIKLEKSNLEISALWVALEKWCFGVLISL